MDAHKPLKEHSNEMEKDENQGAQFDLNKHINYIFDNATDIFLILDSEGIIKKVSPSIKKVTGISPQELIGKKILPILDQACENRKKIKKIATNLLRGGKKTRFEYTGKNKDGKSIVLDVFSIPIFQEGKLEFIFSIAMDVTERKLAFEDLLQTNQFLSSIIDNIPYIITVKDASTLTYRRINNTFGKILGKSVADLVGKTAFDVFPEKIALRLEEEDKRIVKSKTSIEILENIGDENRVFITRKLPIFDSEGKVQSILGISEDVTSQRHTELARQELLEKTLQVNDLKTNFIATASHELKTPLTPIYGWTEMLYAAKKDGKDLNTLFDLEDFESMMRNAERLLHLVEDLLDVGRIESGKVDLHFEMVDFQDILASAIEAVGFFITQKKMRISTTGQSQEVLVDRRRVEQALVNILTNAIKYSPPETDISIKLGQTTDNGKKMFLIQVIDHGYGFTPEELAGAIQPFAKIYTRQEQKKSIPGTGLGLFITRNIIEQHGGILKLSSAGINQGSTVKILLPINQASA